MVTVLPASAVPVTVVPSPETTTLSGARGAVLSGAVAVFGRLALPAPSVAMTVSTSPLVWAGLIGVLKVPSSLAVVVPITVPSGPLMVTVLPASAVPLTLCPSSETCRLRVPEAAWCLWR